MAANQADFTLTFRRLCDAAERPEADAAGARPVRRSRPRYDAWAVALAGSGWREETRTRPARAAAMRAVNPAFIPRNHRVEAMIEAAVERSDFAPFEELLDVLSRPYDGPARRCRLRGSAGGRGRGLSDVLRHLTEPAAPARPTPDRGRRAAPPSCSGQVKISRSRRRAGTNGPGRRVEPVIPVGVGDHRDEGFGRRADHRCRRPAIAELARSSGPDRERRSSTTWCSSPPRMLNSAGE